PGHRPPRLTGRLVRRGPQTTTSASTGPVRSGAPGDADVQAAPRSARPESELLEELVVVRVATQALDQGLHGLDRLHVEEHAAQLLHLVVLALGEELLLLARARLRDVDRGEDALLGQVAVEGDLAVTGALELLEDHLVHAAAGVDERGADDGERAGLLGGAGGAEEALGTLEGAAVHAAGERAAGAVALLVV